MRIQIKYLVKLTALSVFGLVAGVLLTSSTPVSAFSGGGNGSPGSPYLISSCDQFSEITDGDSHFYSLTADIDCTGTNLARKDFAGTFDGRNFTISDATIHSSTDQTGIFETLTGTVKNLKVTGLLVSSSVGHAETGGLAGRIQGGTVSHVSVEGTVSGTDSVGGIAGYAASATIQSTSFTGTVTGTYGNSVGGLAGEVHDGVVEDSYTNATVSGGGNVAGLIGRLFSDSANDAVVRNTYVLGTVSATTVQSAFIAVLTQFSTGNILISDSFTMASTPGHAGQLSVIDSIASGTATATNLYFSGDDTRYNGCGGLSCIAFNDDGTDADHFKNTVSADPLDIWDTNIWDIDVNASPARFPLLRNATPASLGSLTASDAPNSLNTSDLFPTSIGLYWAPPSNDGGSDISEYYVSYKETNSSSWTEVETHSDDTSFTIAGLDSSTSYDFKVAAFNGEVSLYSSEITASTSAPVNHEINSCLELHNMLDDPHGSFTLGGPIDCSMTNPDNENFDSTHWTNEGFEPISYFAGDFNGNGNTISDLYINRTNDWGESLFDTLGNGANIHNLDIEGLYIASRGESAGVTSYIEHDATIQNVNVSGDIYGSGTNAGVVAYTESNGSIIIEQVISSVTLHETPESNDGVYDWGGLMGYVYLNHGTLDINNSRTTVVAESANAEDVGGMIGFLDQYNGSQTTITTDDEELAVQGSILCNSFCGGVIGKVYSGDESGRTSLSITDTIVTADVATIVGAGGLIGDVEGNGLDLDITHSAYAGGLATPNEPNDEEDLEYPGIGGLIGSFYQDDGSIEINNSLVSSDVEVATNNLGGLVGITRSPTDISDSYFQGTLVGYGVITGGMIAQAGADYTITNSYVAGDFLGAAYGGEGGMVGIMIGLGTITDSYVSIGVGSIGGPGAAVVGYRMTDYATINPESTFYVDVAAYSSFGGEDDPHCYGDQDDDLSCNYVNELDEFGEATDPNYFIDNHENAPMDNWDFSDTWYTAEEQHPQLSDLSWVANLEEGPDPDGNPGPGDDHTITTCEDLINIENDLSGNYTLAQDIDCSGVSQQQNGGAGPSPIGSTNGNFTGTFDGGGHTISNFNQILSDTDGGGIFLTLDNALVHDLKISDSFINYDGAGNTGALAATALAGTLVDNVHSNARVMGVANVGGLVGYFSGDSNNIGASGISHSSATGDDVQGSGEQTGGLVGYMLYANLSTSWATGDVTGTNYVGGLVGSSGFLEVNDVYARGDAFGLSYVGGLLGSDGGSTITNAYAAGNVFDGDYSGGFIGVILSSSNITSVYNSFSAGTVNPDGPMGAGTSLGFIGYINGVSPDLAGNYFNGIGDAVCSDRITSDQTCTSADLVANPDMFYYRTNAPMDGSWSFGGTEGPWHESLDDYPTLNPSDLPEMQCTQTYWVGTTGGIDCDVAPTGWGITTWEARYSVHDSTSFTSVALTDPHTCSYTVSGLNPSVEYDLWCRFTNDTGVGEWGRGVLSANPDGGDGTVTLQSAENGSLITLAQGGCAAVQSSGTSKESSLQLADTAYAYPIGLASFTITGCAQGGQANITLVFTGTFSDSTTLRKYNSRTNTYTTLTNANSGLVLSKTTLGGKAALQATYHIIDGGAFDQDGLTDGTVVDPVGLAQLVVGTPNTGFSH